MSIKYSNATELFRSFRNIPQSDFHFMIRFCEQYNTEISHLPAFEQITVNYYYANALYELEYFSEFLPLANEILSMSILHNIQFIDQQDVYKQTLHQKATAHLALRQFDDALRFCKQSLQLTPTNKASKALMRSCLLQSKPSSLVKCLALGVLFSFLALGLLLFDHLLVETIYPEWQNSCLWAQRIVLASSVLCTSYAVMYYYLNIHKPIQQEIQHSQRAEA